MGDRKQSQADSKEVEEVLNKQAVDGISNVAPRPEAPMGLGSWFPGQLTHTPERVHRPL